MGPKKIIQGGSIDMIININNSKTLRPFDLTTCTALTTCFENTDGTELMLALGTGVTIVDALMGQIKVSLTAVQTALLRSVQAATLELKITLTGGPLKVQIPDAYDVLQTVC